MRFHLHEGFQHAVDILFRNADAVIFDLDE